MPGGQLSQEKGHQGGKDKTCRPLVRSHGCFVACRVSAPWAARAYLTQYEKNHQGHCAIQEKSDDRGKIFKVRTKNLKILRPKN